MRMKQKRQGIEALKHTGLMAVLVAGICVLVTGQARASQGAADKGAPGALAGIEISFKLDPRLTRGLYMGDRWVSETTYTGTAGQDTVDARVRGFDAKGATVTVSPQWIPSDPEMVTVSPSEGNDVRITVKRAGESRLRVTAEGLAKELAVKAAYKNAAIQVEIAQVGQTRQPTGAAIPSAAAFKTPKEKLSYALGMNLVSQLRKQRVDIDADSYVRGLRDALSSGPTLLTEAEAGAAVRDLQAGMTRKQPGSQAAKLKNAAEKYAKEGAAFLAANKTREGVFTLESGLQYRILKAGDGPKPTAEDTVVCHYRGTLIDGTEFDSSRKRNQPATFAVKKVIKGWTEALQLMPVGSTWQLFVPPAIAYGPRGAPGGKIGPNATLIFEVELISSQGRS